MNAPDMLAVQVPVATLWTAPDAPRAVDAPAVADEPDVVTWTQALDAAARKGLYGRTLTQLLLGEPVELLEERAGWGLVRALRQPSSGDPAGYPGWMRRAHLASPVPAAGSAVAVVSATSPCRLDSGETLRLSFGTLLPLPGRAGANSARAGANSPRAGANSPRAGANSARAGANSAFMEVLLPGDRLGRVPRSSVRHLPDPGEPAWAGEGQLTAARQFVGLRYLWGGNSAWGLDCSGLVHLTYRAHGVVVPRDACDQAAEAAPVPLADARAGDLYFFARPGEEIHHVGFATRAVATDGIRWMLHATETGDRVEEAAMAPYRMTDLVSAGRLPSRRTEG